MLNYTYILYFWRYCKKDCTQIKCDGWIIPLLLCHYLESLKKVELNYIFYNSAFDEGFLNTTSNIILSII